MSGPNPRKRPAPGAAPTLPVTPAQQSAFGTSPQEQILRWSNSIDPATFNDVARNGNAFVMGATPGQCLQQPPPPPPQATSPQMHAGLPPQPQPQPPPQQQQQVPPTSTAIARRTPNRALIPSASRPHFDAVTEWAAFGEDGLGGPNGGVPGENESIEVLEERAQRIKKEAQVKRKQIPPFVQKLSSFLEEQKNTELIRWSESGDSFIVLDEDEFAKTLIPELFKHNNYASFVRQLNMYGFHKRVGLSDNSMKASERKNKSPSEYYNPYFKRGHPNLLWLINKPKGGNKARKGKKDDGDGDSEDEGGAEEPLIHGGLQGLSSAPSRPYASGGGGGELGPLQRKDFQVIKEELNTLQTRQAHISKVMQRLQYDNAQLQQQARLFQNMHERHENSINAILNFLANVFRKSLEEQGGVQGVTELLASILPNGTMPQGSVVDVSDDFDQQRPSVATAMGTPQKRPQRLLPPIPGPPTTTTTASSVSGHGSAGMSPAASQQAASSSGLPGGGGPSVYHSANINTNRNNSMGSVTELFDSPSDMTSSTYLQQELQANPQEGMMKIIQDTNANTPTSAAGIDLSEMAATTPISLSSDQRNRVLSLMSGQSPDPLVDTGPLGGMSGTSAPSSIPIPATTTTAAGQIPMSAASMAGRMPMTGPGGVSMTPQVPLTIPTTGAGSSSSNGGSIHPGGAGVGAGVGAGLGMFSGGLPDGAGGGGGDFHGLPLSGSTSLSPILAQVPQVPPPPSLRDISNTQAEIEALQKLQEEQNAKISDLSQMLGPLSPSGRIPGIDDDGIPVGAGPGGGGGGQSPGYFDLGQYLDTAAFGDDFNFATGDLNDSNGAAAAAAVAAAAAGNHAVPQGVVPGPEEDFNFGLTQDGLGDKSPSPAITEEIPRSDLQQGGGDASVKRRRLS